MRTTRPAKSLFQRIKAFFGQKASPGYSVTNETYAPDIPEAMGLRGRDEHGRKVRDDQTQRTPPRPTSDDSTQSDVFPLQQQVLASQVAAVAGKTKPAHPEPRHTPSPSSSGHQHTTHTPSHTTHTHVDIPHVHIDHGSSFSHH